MDGCIQAAGDGSDLSIHRHQKQYENFILDWDWKLSPGGNSMLYHVVENPYFKVPMSAGPGVPN